MDFNQYMDVKNINLNTPSFQAQFIPGKSLSKIVEYAQEKGKLEKLAAAEKNIAACYKDVYLKVSVFVRKEKPGIIFYRFKPKKNVTKPKGMQDLVLSKIKSYKSKKKCDPMKYALHKLIRLGYDVPNYNLFQEVVVKEKKK